MLRSGGLGLTHEGIVQRVGEIGAEIFCPPLARRRRLALGSLPSGALSSKPVIRIYPMTGVDRALQPYLPPHKRASKTPIPQRW
jgi:hypothetical protein